MPAGSRPSSSSLSVQVEPPDRVLIWKPQLHQDLCVLHRGEDASVTPHVGAQAHQLHTGTVQNLPRNLLQLLPAEYPLPEIPHVHHEHNGVNLPLPDSCIGHGADDLNLALEATVSPAHHLLGLVNGGYADEQVVQAGYGGLGGDDVFQAAVREAGDAAGPGRPDHPGAGGEALGDKGQLHPPQGAEGVELSGVLLDFPGVNLQYGCVHAFNPPLYLTTL